MLQDCKWLSITTDPIIGELEYKSNFLMDTASRGAIDHALVISNLIRFKLLYEESDEDAQKLLAD